MPRRRKPPRRLTCPGCRQEFTALRSTAKTCSDACRAKVWKRRTGYVHPATLAKREENQHEA